MQKQNVTVGIDLSNTYDKVLDYLDLCNTERLQTLVTKHKRHLTEVVVKMKTTLPLLNVKKSISIPPKYKKRLLLNDLKTNNFIINVQNVNLIPGKVPTFQTIDLTQIATPRLPDTNRSLKFDNYKRVDAIRRYDMVYDVKQLHRLQKQRELKFYQQLQTNVGHQNSIIKTQNKLFLIENTNNQLERLKNASERLIAQFQNQTRDGNKIADQCYQSALNRK